MKFQSNFVLCEPAGLSNKLFKKSDFTLIGYLLISCPSTFFIWQEQERLKGDKGREILGPHYGCFPSLSLRWSSRSAAEDLNLRSPESLRLPRAHLGFSMNSKLSATFHNTLFSPILNLWNCTRVHWLSKSALSCAYLWKLLGVGVFLLRVLCVYNAIINNPAGCWPGYDSLNDTILNDSTSLQL